MVGVQSIPSPAITADERSHEVDHPSSQVAQFGTEQPLRLDCGVDLSPFQIAYQTYGVLNADRSNAVLLCHALTGDQHVANVHPVTGKPGWWDTLVGPGRPIDPQHYFIICSNVIGGCMGSTGPASINPATGKVWGLEFPVITIPDMVRAQAMLIDRLGIDTLFAVVGGSMGGMQVLQWTAAYPSRVFSALAIACSTRHSAQNIAFHELGRQAVMADPDWHSGGYAEHGLHPHRGLAVARMAAHITYLSDAALHRKFGRRMQDRELPTFSFDAGLPGRVLSALPGLVLRRALRRQFLSLSDAGDGLFRHRRRPWRRAGEGVRGNPDPLLRGLLHQRLAVPDLGIARAGTCAERIERAGIVRRDRDRSRPRRLLARRARIP
ncbi:homoserine O-acetyltransferase [Bradyrhizobium sp. LB7.1]